MMNTFISGERQYNFVSKFKYVREAVTCSEQRAAEKKTAMHRFARRSFLFLHHRLSALSLR